MTARHPIILGIESSCDESAAAVVRLTDEDHGEILSNHVLSQIEDHQPYGGVVPEIAARAHIEHLDHLVEAAMAEAGLSYQDLDGVAATAGPGLIGGVLVGLMTGKGIALSHNKPFIGINHLEGHALTARLLDRSLTFPYLLLLISGGHCQLLSVEGVGQYTLFGTTMDDAVGEAFDKTAKLMDLGYPGGPAIEKAATQGNPKSFDLPQPLKGREGCDFSFSGLKTAVRQCYESLLEPSDRDRTNLAASFQQTVIDVLTDRCDHAMQRFAHEHTSHNTSKTFVVAGGVAANQAIRHALNDLCAKNNYTLSVAPPHLCTDNAAMIAWAGLERLRLGLVDGFELAAKARWPLEDLKPGRS